MRIAMAGLLALGMATPVAAQTTIGPHTFYQWSGNGHWYALTAGGPTSFYAAEAEANAVGANPAANPLGTVAAGYLASVHSAAENDFLVNTFGSACCYWIGLHQPGVNPEPAGGWVWTSGEAVTYTNWNPGEPNDAGGEDAAHLNWAVSGGWNDVPWQEPYEGIMEFETLPASTVPEPVTLVLLGSGLAGVALARRRKRLAAP